MIHGEVMLGMVGMVRKKVKLIKVMIVDLKNYSNRVLDYFGIQAYK